MYIGSFSHYKNQKALSPFLLYPDVRTWNIIIRGFLILTIMDYKEFLQSKQKTHTLSGFHVELSELNNSLFPFQKFCVQRALKAGKYALFEDCGLGKTFQQLEWANQVVKYTNKPVLILAPLAVVGQTLQESSKWNIVTYNYSEFSKCTHVFESSMPATIFVTNYEQLDNIDTSIFSGIVLDESSILKNFEGATKKLILDKFVNTPYKLACTATPSPNDPMELGNHAEFLDVMSRNEMLAMYFVHDGGETAKWRLKGHATKLFYQFVGSWAIMLNKPQDIGFEMDGYSLPSLNLIENQIKTPKRDNGSLFNDAIISATNFNQELRLTKFERLEEVVRIVNERPDENFLIWIKQNEEGEELRKLLPEAVEISGSDSLDRKEFVSLWFGNHKNECICQTNSKEEKKNINLSTGQNIMPKINHQLTQQQTLELKKEENQTQYLEKKEYNTIENTIPKIKTSLTEEHPNNQQKEIKRGEKNMLMMHHIEKSKSNIQENHLKKETKESITHSEKSMESQLSNINQCLSSKIMDAQYAETTQHSSIHNKDYTSTTAIKQGEYEDSYVQTAIKELESLMIQKYCSNVPLCTCCGKHKRKILISKTKILSFGLNYQNCRNQIFASLDFSFEGLYQAIRRSYRFGQTNEVNIYMITTDTMSNVIQSINQKQKQFEIMQNEMAEAINSNLSGKLLSESTYDIEEEKNDFYHIQRGDSVQLIDTLPDESIGLSVFSPPFAELYTYSSHVEDMGNSKDYNEFLTQFGFLIEKLHKKMMPGRNVCVHCMDLPIQKGKEGFIGLRDFSGMILKVFEDCGFIYHSRVTIWKDPVVEMQRTKALGLLHKQVKKDSTMSRVGIPDYVLIFRKDGERDNPVRNTDMSVDLWQKYASPVWMDINYSDTLQGFRNGREDNDEKHICPLQLPTIERLIHLYSNKGDVVFTPFMGIGSEVYQAVKMDRVGWGIELKESYFDLAKSNCKMAISEKSQISLF